MYREIKDEKQLQIFNNIWKQCWKERGYEIEYSTGIVDRYIILDREELAVGSVEFKPFTKENEINEFFPFHQLLEMKNENHNLVEIDKVAILKDHRNDDNLVRLVSTMIAYGDKHKVDYAVAELEPRFYYVLKRFMRLPVKRVGENIFYKGDYVTPVICDVKSIRKNKSKYTWFLDPATV